MSKKLLKSIINQPKLPSRDIPGYIKDLATGNLTENSPLKYLWQFKKQYIRKRYASFGRKSGLKPGVCWPTKDELDFMKQYEAKFEKSLTSMHQELLQRKQAEQERKIKREKEILANLQKLPQMKQEFWKNYHKLHEDIELEKTKKDKLIQEVREYLGYDIEPNDPRFEEALAKKDEEAKAAIRAARKLEKQKQHMEMLQTLVSEALEKEKVESKKTPHDADTNQKTQDDKSKTMAN